MLYAVSYSELDVNHVMPPLGDVLSPSEDDNSRRGDRLVAESPKAFLYLVPIGVFFCPLDTSCILGDKVVPPGC